MNKAKILLGCLVGIPLLAALLYKKVPVEKEGEEQVIFHKYLSQYQLFDGELSRLIPTEGIELIELQSTLFTDYTEKQRLLKLPEHQQMVVIGDGLPQYPEGTLIAKTFYYPQTTDNQGRRLIETRLLIKGKSKWHARTYQWFQAQEEAELLEEGAVVPVTFIDVHGKEREVRYEIPSTADCRTCHQVGNQLMPIGFKMRNMNREVHRAGGNVNQLTYLENKDKVRRSYTS